MIFKNNKCFIIAEIGQAHDGSLSLAHSYIDEVAKTGADAIKFQTHIAQHESSKYEKFRIKRKYQKDKSRYDYWKRMEFSKREWKGLFEHAKERKLVFLSSPFSIEAANLLNEIGLKMWKVASGEFYNTPLIEFLVKTKKPILLSTGMSSWKEIDEKVKFLKKYSQPSLIFQCTSQYPTPSKEIGINLIQEMKKRYKIPIGFSDHSGQLSSGIAAYVSGARALEVHVTLSKNIYNFDLDSSLSMNELSELTNGIRFLEGALNNPLDKDFIARKMKKMKSNFTSSVMFKNDMKKGSIIKFSDLSFKKPGSGIPAEKYKLLIGKKLKKDVNHNIMIKLNDFK